jgi:hypothetical protein
MAFIDWSDAEGILDLLVEYIADEKRDVRGDINRRQFLKNLLKELKLLREQLPTDGVAETIVSLQTIHSSITPEFVDDPAVEHITACIEELEQIQAGSAAEK